MSRQSKKSDKLNLSKGSSKALQAVEKGIPVVTNKEVRKSIKISVNLHRAVKKLRIFLSHAHYDAFYLEGDGLQAAIYRYEKFWLPMLHDPLPKSSLMPTPPPDVYYVWILHMTMPYVFKEEYNSVTGRLATEVNHRLLTQPNLEVSQRKTRSEWNRKYKDEEWADTRDSKYFDDNDRTPKLDVDNLLQYADFMKTFMYQVFAPQYKSKAFIVQAIKRYRQYLMLHRNNETVQILPAPDIYLVWMAHVIHTKKYKEDTTNLFGEVFDHRGDSCKVFINYGYESSKAQNMISKSNETWGRMFARPYFCKGTMYRGREPDSYLSDINHLIPKVEHMERYEVNLLKVNVAGKFKKGPYIIRINVYDPIFMKWGKLAKLKWNHDGKRNCERDVTKYDIKFSLEDRVCDQCFSIHIDSENAMGKVKQLFGGRLFHSLSSLDELRAVRDDGGVIKKLFEDRGSSVELLLRVTKDRDTCFKTGGVCQAEVMPGEISSAGMANEYGIIHNNKMLQLCRSLDPNPGVHRVLDDGTVLRCEIFEIEVMKTPSAELSSITVHGFRVSSQKDDLDGPRKNRVPVARIHTLDQYALPTLSQLKCTPLRPGRFPTVNFSGGEKAVLTKWVNGDHALVIGHWQKIKGRKSIGYLVVRIYQESTPQPYCVAVPIDKLLKSKVLNSNSVTVNRGHVVMSETPENFLGKTMIGLAILTLYTLFRPLTAVMAVGTDFNESYSFNSKLQLPDKPPLEQLVFLADLADFCLTSRDKGKKLFRKERIESSVDGKRLRCYVPSLAKEDSDSSSCSSDSDSEYSRSSKDKNKKKKKTKKDKKKEKKKTQAEASLEPDAAIADPQTLSSQLYPAMNGVASAQPAANGFATPLPLYGVFPTELQEAPLVPQAQQPFAPPLEEPLAPPLDEPLAPPLDEPLAPPMEASLGFCLTTRNDAMEHDEIGWDIPGEMPSVMDTSPQPVSIVSDPPPVAPAQVSQPTPPSPLRNFSEISSATAAQLVSKLPDVPTQVPKVKKEKRHAIAVGVEVLPTSFVKVIPSRKSAGPSPAVTKSVTKQAAPAAEVDDTKPSAPPVTEKEPSSALDEEKASALKFSEENHIEKKVIEEIQEKKVVTVQSMKPLAVPQNVAAKSTLDERPQKLPDKNKEKTIEASKSIKGTEEKKADKTVDETTTNKTVEDKKADKSVDEKKTDKSLDEKKPDKFMDEKTADKTVEDKKADKSVDEKTANKSVEDKKVGKSVNEAKADKSMDEKTANKTVEDKKADKSLNETKADKSVDEKTDNKSVEVKKVGKSVNEAKADKSMDEKTANNTVEDKKADKSVNEKTDNKIVGDKKTNKYVNEKKADNLIENKKADKLIGDEKVDKHMEDKKADKLIEESNTEKPKEATEKIPEKLKEETVPEEDEQCVIEKKVAPKQFEKVPAKPQKKLSAKEKRKQRKQAPQWDEPPETEEPDDITEKDFLEDDIFNGVKSDDEPEPQPEIYLSAKERKRLAKEQKRDARRPNKGAADDDDDKCEKADPAPSKPNKKLTKQEKRQLKNERNNRDFAHSGDEGESNKENDCNQDDDDQDQEDDPLSAFTKTSEPESRGKKKLSKKEKRQMLRAGKASLDSDNEDEAASPDMLKVPTEDDDSEWGTKKKGKKGRRK